MPDFNDAVALGIKPPSGSDVVAPLQAYALSQEGAYAGVRAQDAASSLAARQRYADSVAAGGDPTKSFATSGVSVDPTAASTTLGNIQGYNTLGALRNYAANPSDPKSLAMAGPEAVGRASLADYTQAQTDQQRTLTEGEKMDLRGRLGLAALQNPSDDTVWGSAVNQARSSGLIGDLHVADAMKWSPQQRAAVAKSWAAAGNTSVVNSGISTGAQEKAKTDYSITPVPPGYKVLTGPGITTGMSPGQAPGGPGQGRSAAVDGTSSTPASSPPANSPPAMAQAENQYGLPSGYLGRTAQIESGGRADARNASGAAGLMQIMPSTWKQYAQPGQSPYNPADAIDVGSRLAADNQKALTNALGRPPTGGELYLAHQQGGGGAAALLNNPNARAADIVGAKAVVSNGGTPNMSAGQFASMWVNKFNGGQGGNFGLSGPSPTGPGVAMPSAPGSASPYGALGPGPTGSLAAAAGNPPASSGLGAHVGQISAPPPPPVLGNGPVPAAGQTGGRSASSSGSPTSPQNAAPDPNAPVKLSVAAEGLSPFALEKQRLDASRAVEEEKGARDQFVSANSAQQGLLQLQDDLTKLTPAKGAGLLDTLLTPGSGAETRIGLAKTINSASASIGGAPVFDPQKIAAAESSQKITGRLGFDLAGGLGKGEAGFIVQQAIGLNPSIMSTPQGAKILIGSLMATQQRQKDLYLFQKQYSDAHGGNPIGAEVMFDQNLPAMKYVQDAKNLARVPPAAAKALQQNGNNQGMISAFNSKYGDGLARYYIGSRTQ